MKLIQVSEDTFYDALRNAVPQETIDDLWQRLKEMSLVTVLANNRLSIIRLLTAMSESDDAKASRHDIIFKTAISLLQQDAPRELPVAVDILLEHVERNLETHGTTDSENIASLIDLVKARTDPRFSEIDACFEAAYVEGLADVLNDYEGMRLASLVQRRLLPARAIAQAAMQSMTEADWRITLAREIWRYNECPWDFDNPNGDMANLQKQLCIDQAECIRVLIFHRLQIATKPSASKRAVELANALEGDDFQCEAGPLKMRLEWNELKNLIGSM